jgi:hypothetical protein
MKISIFKRNLRFVIDAPIFGIKQLKYDKLIAIFLREIVIFIRYKC